MTNCAFCKSIEIYITHGEDYAFLDFEKESAMTRISIKEDGCILQCKSCNAYYYFRQWSPGGSDDAMTTTTYQDFYPINSLDNYELYDPDADLDGLDYFMPI